MTKIMIRTIAICTLLLSSYSAYAVVDITGVGSLNLNSQTFTVPGQTFTVTPNMAWGFGALVALDLLKVFQIEAGAMYLPQSTTSISSGSTTSFTVTGTYIDIPLMIRFKPISFISVGAGGYYGIANGSFTQTSSPGGTVTPGNFNNDLGLIGGVQARLPLLPLLGIVARGDYLFGLANLSQAASSTINTRAILVSAGLQLSI